MAVLRQTLGACVAAGILAGCSGNDPPPPPLCPEVGIINGLEDLEQQAADGSGQLAYRAAMENLDGACKAEGGDLAVEIAIDLVVQPGPAAPAGIIELPYFVAISAPDGRVLDRQDFVGSGHRPERRPPWRRDRNLQPALRRPRGRRNRLPGAVRVCAA